MRDNNEIIPLPQYQEPTDLEDAKIKIFELGVNLHEHAYILGKTLIWARDKIGTTAFGHPTKNPDDNWITNNVWFGLSTAYRFMGHSKKCDRAGHLLEYHPKQNKPSVVTVTTPGRFSTIIIDPPWPIKKVERYERPYQEPNLDYPNMTVDAIKQSTFPFDEHCHVYLWTTQKYLPIAFECFIEWEVKYIQTLVWHKNVGFTPMGLFMNNAEFVLFGRKGSLPLLKAGEKCVFTGKVREHSRKPDEFYDLVRKVSPEPRIDCFSREKREGFDQFGNETNKYNMIEARYEIGN